MDPKLFVATKAFILNQGKVLVLRESGLYQDGTNSGRYDLPGGRLNPGEAVMDGLQLEILEETGLTVEVTGPLTVNEWRPTVRGEEWHIVGIFFLCEAASSEVQVSGDHDAYEWINPRAYKEVGVIDNLSAVFEAYLKRLG